MKCGICGFEDSKEHQSCRLCGSDFKTQKHTEKQPFIFPLKSVGISILSICILGYGLYYAISNQKKNKLNPNSDTQQVISTNAFDGLSSHQLVIKTMNYAMDDGGIKYEPQIEEAITRIQAFPKPAKGNKKSARSINEQGLTFINSGAFEEARKLFMTAHELDPADVEITNNLGYALLKTGNFDSAKQVLIQTLSLAPRRAAAWSNLGDAYANMSETDKAVACYSNVYRFSKDRNKTYQFMQKLNGQENIDAIKQARQTAMDWAIKIYSDIYE
jgi:tetratricopeptide (TPR) repeat protein